ncbi:UPF0223 family protein [Lactovum miscens]|uniref:Uncharacterized protein YktA (UPF0223 family) n=1 Tax=Lactovum miscens TaxID=190387 RepID=A0A841C8B4_9LACT|nr:UPF0223 family protein [Lactovum miscens]MBB5888547.1 uncharacterized protein YktA (UPF0223 family) [Lactovum miscens]
MSENYQYPLSLSWTPEEMAIVIAFLNQVENYYEAKVDEKKFLLAYQAFKKVVPSIGQEKQLDREFEQVSGYSSYQAIKGVRSK